MINFSDDYLIQLLPEVHVGREEPVKMQWLTRKDALIYARRVLAAAESIRLIELCTEMEDCDYS